VLQTTTDDDKRQRQLLVWPSYTMCGWTSNNDDSRKCQVDHALSNEPQLNRVRYHS